MKDTYVTPRQTSQTEFVALVAMLFATIALSIDAMLPALPASAAELSPQAVNKAQLVVTSFVFGMGLGTLIAGPISDAFGRKPVILIFAALYLAATALCIASPSLTLLLTARVIQGIGAAGPRAVATAMVRDRFKGRDMARVMSFVMMIFTLVPAIAPLLGQGILLFGAWRSIFAAFMVFALIVNTWLALRQPETLPVPQRRPLNPALLWQATKDLTQHRIALISTLCQSLSSAALFATLSSQQSIFDQRFDRAATFPLWFGIIALCAISGSLLNSRLVMRVGMRAMVKFAYAMQLGLSAVLLTLTLTHALPEALAFPLHILRSVGVFAVMGLTMGNLNAMAMEDLGHIAGFAASVITAASTVLSVLMAVPVGLAFDGTQVPLLAGVTVFAATALFLMRFVDKPKPT